jgi:hypothetical protein
MTSVIVRFAQSRPERREYPRMAYDLRFATMRESQVSPE